MNLAVFDLDHTLLAGDSDYLWGRFLVEHGLVDGERYEQANRRFYEDYRAGTLDIHAFASFSLEPLKRLPPELLLRLRQTFVEQRVAPIVATGTPALLARHRRAGDALLITTATNRFITEPIAALLGVPALLATEPERDGDRFTGRLLGIPNFRAGKVARLEQWLAAQPRRFDRIYAYSDSHNDLPLLERADHPVAVDPDPMLRAEAQRRGWAVISLRTPAPEGAAGAPPTPTPAVPRRPAPSR